MNPQNINPEDVIVDFEHDDAEEIARKVKLARAMYELGVSTKPEANPQRELLENENTSDGQQMRYSSALGQHKLEPALRTLNTSLEAGERVLLVGHLHVSADSSIIGGLFSFLATLFFLIMFIVGLMMLALGVPWILIGILIVFAWYLWQRPEDRAAFPSGLYAVTNHRVLRILRNNNVECIDTRNDIQRIQKHKGIVTLTLGNGDKLQLSIEEGQHLPGSSIL